MLLVTENQKSKRNKHQENQQKEKTKTQSTKQTQKKHKPSNRDGPQLRRRWQIRARALILRRVKGFERVFKQTTE